MLNLVGYIWKEFYERSDEDWYFSIYMQCIFLDNTQSHRVMEEAEKAHRETETLTKTIPGGVAQVAIDDNFRILLASDGFYRMTGYTQQEYHSNPVSGKGKYVILKEDIPQLTASVQEQLEKGGPLYAEYRIKKKNDDITWMAAYGSNMAKKNGVVISDGTV